jgi:hypothetical protein
MAEKEIRFDPRIFIQEPFIECPKCKAVAEFGVLMIGSNQYTRRCRQCWHTDHYDLPKLRKIIIYLDQFVISKMMEVLSMPQEKITEGSIEAYWWGLFEKLDRLCKVQLIVCPDSTFHHKESVVWKFYERLKTMYEHLSGGASFHHSETIKRFHIVRCAKQWLRGEAFDINKILGKRMISCEVDGWQERFSIALNIQTPSEWVEDLRRTRDESHEAMAKVFARWQQEKAGFTKILAEELASFGRGILDVHAAHIIHVKDMVEGKAPFDPESFLPPHPSLIVNEVRDRFVEAGVPTNEVMAKVIDFFLSDSLQQVPFVRIQAMLFAAVARKAAAGQKKSPSRGFFNDVGMISTILPYSDVMFIDNELAGLLAEEPIKSRLNYGAKIFSLTTRDKFDEYLDLILHSIPASHLAKVREVYGEGWEKPFTGIYDSNRP